MQFLTYKFTNNFCSSYRNVVIKYPVHSLTNCWSLKSKDIRCNIFCFLYSSVFPSRKKMPLLAL